MRDRRTYDERRPPDRGRDTSQRNALIAIAFFIAAFAFVGVMLLTGRGDDDPSQSNAATTPSFLEVAGSTASPDVPTATQGLGGTQPTVTMPAAPTVTVPAVAPTSTEEAVVEEDEPTEGTIQEPTEEIVEEPVDEEPTPEPLIGDFGALPPAQIVSGGLSRGLTLDYVLDRSSVSAPTTGTVYKFIWPEYTADDVATMAANLGVDGDVKVNSSTSYSVVGSSRSLYVRTRSIQYSNSSAATAPLADDGTLIASAESWLASSGLVSTGVGSGQIIGRNDEADIAVVFVQPANPSPLLAAFPSASITVTGAGVVREANIQWPVDYVGSEYGMRSLSEVWNQVVAGQGAIEADMSDLSGAGTVSATFTVESIGIAYSVGSGSEGEFLLPIMVFSGTAVTDDGSAFPVWVYMSAVQGEASAAG